ncbi:MAG: right-handed parallel beta-helix repeat-containing protein [Actinobacteria bacterium]|nr:right-handed parallel beta-helix repeat-containing protein [Actinomycetota bacterium]
MLRTVEPSCAQTRRCNAPIVDLSGTVGVTLRDGAIRGGFAVGDRPRYDATREKDHGIRLHGVRDATLSGLTISNVGGDCVDVDRDGRNPSFRVLIAGSDARPFTCVRAGRQGISANAVEDLTIRQIRFDLAGQSFVDVGPQGRWKNDGILIESNVFGWAANRAVFATGPSRALHNVVVRNNVQTDARGRGFLLIGNPYARGPLTITGNRVAGSLRVVHMSGSARDNVMASNPRGVTCMFVVTEPPRFVVQGNRPGPGVRERC